MPFLANDAEGRGSYSILIVDWRRSRQRISWFVGMLDVTEGPGLATLELLIKNGLPDLITSDERHT